VKTCKILVLVGCRSDEGLSAPIIRRLKADNIFEVYKINLIAPQFKESYEIIEHFCQTIKPDLVFCTGDRIEMTAGACASFHNRRKIAHYGAGIINDPITTLDDINRHYITMMADLAFCICESEARNVVDIWDFIKKININDIKNNLDLKNLNIYNVGLTHMDDIEIDESLVPSEGYDLILINPTTIINEIQQFESIRKTIIIGPNPDKPLDNLWDYKIDYNNLPRPLFMGLLKNCTKFITNSSAAYYEAPYFLKPEQIVLVGLRNKNRSGSNFKYGASDKIVKILKKWWMKENGY